MFSRKEFFCTFLLVLGFANRIRTQPPVYHPDELLRVIEEKEQFLVGLANHTEAIFEQRNHFIENCSCSKYAGFNNVFDVACGAHYGQHKACDFPCNRRITYVCKFETDAPCSAGVADIPKGGFFKVPPLDRCVDEIEALDETRPVKDVKKLSVEDVMCDLGKERTNKELICCTVDEDDVCQAGKGSSSKKDCR